MHQLSRRLLSSAALVALLALAACGGKSNGCLMAPCEGDFPEETSPAAKVNPGSLTVGVGTDATFTVDSTGLASPTYQWYRTSRGGSLQQIVGATGASYTLVGAQPADDGAAFKAQVDGGYGAGRLVQFSSEATLAVR